MTDDRIDFSQLEPRNGEALVRAIRARTAPLLAERRSQSTTVQLAAWWPAVTAAAIVIALLSTLVLANGISSSPQRAAPVARGEGPRSERRELAEALGVPRVLAVSLTSQTTPRAREFLRELGR